MFGLEDIRVRCVYCQKHQRIVCASVKPHSLWCCQRTLPFWEHRGQSLFWGMGFGNTERHHAKSPSLKQYSTFEWNIWCSFKYFRPRKRRLGAEPPKPSTRVALKRPGMSSHSQGSPVCISQWLNSSERVLLIFLKIFPGLPFCHFSS